MTSGRATHRSRGAESMLVDTLLLLGMAAGTVAAIAILIVAAGWCAGIFAF